MKMTLKRMLLFAIAAFCFVYAEAQEKKTVSGTVKDPDGKPLESVTVVEKGTQNQTQTNSQGSFKLTVANNATLVLTSVGFKTRSVVLKGTSDIHVSMEKDQQELDEVVAIGYGKASKRYNPNSVSSAPVKALQNRPVGSIEGLLQGLVPGLLVQNNSGAPGGRSNISIRGLANFSSSANSNVVSTPLFIIDGIPQEQDAFNPSDPRQAITSVLAGINPFDLESVDVLKDAAATSIYGSRGANGVIIITTKRGKAGKPIVFLNAQYGGGFYPSLRKTYGGAAERRFKADLFTQYSTGKVGGGSSDMPIELTDSLNPYYNNSTNWQKLYFRPSYVRDINMGVSGANENASYRVGASYYDEQGNVVGSGFKRYSLTYTGMFNPTKKLTITARTNLSQTDASLNRGQTFGAAVVGNNYPSSFKPGPGSEYTYAFLEAYRQGVSLDITRRVMAQLEASLDITDYLNLTSRASGNYTFYRTRNFNPSAANADGKASASYYSNENVNYLSETILRFHKLFNKHSLDVFVGNTINTSETNSIDGSASGGPSDAMQVIQGYPQNRISLVTHNISYGLLSYFGRFTYDFSKKYILQGSLRTDASSKFGKDKQWGYFPSASAAWIVSKENFFKNNIGNWLSFAKLRASIGKAGEQYQDNYLALGAYNTTGTYNGVPMLSPNYGGSNGIPIPNLTWQTSKEYTLGTEIEFFKGRLTSVFEYYHKDKNGFLFPDPLNSTSGYSSRFLNSGGVRNTGVDISLTGYLTAPKNKLQYTITFNGSTNKNTLTQLPDFGRSVTRTGYANGDPYLQVGKPLNGFYLLKYLGVYAKAGDVPYNPYTGARLRPLGAGFASQDPYKEGDIKLYDANGDYVIDNYGNADKVYMGSPNPKFFGSLSHAFTYRLRNNSSIQLNMFFNYSIGNRVYNKVLAERIKSVSWTASQNVNYPGGQTNLVDVSDVDFWTPTNTNAKYPVLNPWRYYALSSYDFIGNYDNNTSLFLENGSFIRLNNINLGYDFSPQVLQKYKIRRLRVFAGLDNIFLLSNYSGVDPENVDSYGYDQGNGYPIPKKYNMGLNFEF